MTKLRTEAAELVAAAFDRTWLGHDAKVISMREGSR
jgi:hypothetical protein